MALAFNGEGNCFYVPDEELKHELTPEAVQELNEIMAPAEDSSDEVKAYAGICNIFREKTRLRDGCDAARSWAKDTARNIKDRFNKWNNYE